MNETFDVPNVGENGATLREQVFIIYIVLSHLVW